MGKLYWIAYRGEKERLLLEGWCQKYDIKWCTGDSVKEIPIEYCDGAIVIYKGSHLGNICYGSLKYMLKFYNAIPHYFLFNPKYISSYIDDNVIKENDFVELIRRSQIV